MAHNQPVRLPRDILSESQIADRAEAIRLQHDPDDRIPVPIDEIIEFGLKINVVVSMSLDSIGGDEVDGYLTPDLQEIRVDSHSYFHVPERCRFTLAHECGHAVLHPKVYTEFARDLTLGQYRELMANLDQVELGWIEYQANCFAGHLLVPPRHLKRHFDSIRTQMRIDTPVRQGDFEAIVPELRAKFNVSAAVLRIRCVKDNLVASDPR